MTNNIHYIINYTEGNLSNRMKQIFEKRLQENDDLRHEYRVYKQLNEYMRAKLDLEEVNNDPSLQEIDPFIKDTISEYNLNTDKYKDYQKIITSALHERILDFNLKEELDQIKLEVNEHNINEISEGWVKDWLEKNPDRKTIDPGTETIKNYIRQSLETKRNSSVLKIIHQKKISWKSPVILRMAGLMAAALIAGFLLITTLIPSDNPGKLYTAFYKPLHAVSPVTRGINSSLTEKYTEAIEMYNQGNYTAASSMFNNLILSNNSLVAPHFYQGITQLELGRYEQAISEFSIVTAHSGEYVKEAQWYLGLAYLKTGEMAKALPYFEILAGSEGYYQNQSKKILRRLK